MQSSRVRLGDLSASWVLENPIDGKQEHPRSFQVLKIQFLIIAEGNEGQLKFHNYVSFCHGLLVELDWSCMF